MTCPVLVYSAAIAGVALNGMYLLNVYLIFKVLEVFALTNQLGNFFRFERTKFGFFQKNFSHRLSGAKKAPITSRGCNSGRNRKSPLRKGFLLSQRASWQTGICLYNVQDITVIMS